MSDNARRIGNEPWLRRVSTTSGRKRFDLRHCNGGRGGRAASGRLKSVAFVGLGVAASLVLFSADARAAVSNETQFVLNSFSFLVWGALVMWMCAGFTMLEAGSVRTKNASVICLKNIGLYAIAGLMFYLIGYNIMYVGVEEGGWFGTLTLFYGTSADEVKLLAGAEGADKVSAAVVATGKATMSDWFFQMVFVATTASIVSGALAERVRLWSFLLFITVLTAIIYPVIGSWTWGSGWLNAMGFQDFAGSTIVHSTGGWAALGVFILWMGWFGFSGGSQLALSGAADAVAISNILANTNLAAAAGVIAAMALSRPVLGRVDLMASLNGAIGGLVAITAGPDIVQHYWAVVIGGVGGAIVVVGVKLLDRLKIDDVVGAIPAHLFAGIWGTLAVCIAAGGNLLAQITGILAVGAFVFATSWVVWWVINATIGARITPVAEKLGQDVAELGIEAYPEFIVLPEIDD